MEKDSDSFTLFYNSSAIYLTENYAEWNVPGYEIKGTEKVKLFFEEYLKNSPSRDSVLFGSTPEVLFQEIKSYFTFVEAAGGLVLNEKQEYLFIKRLGVWDLPKGKMEKGERPVECALREVQEETAVKDLNVLKELRPTFHIYFRKQKYYLKQTHWFMMSTSSKSPLIPQTKEDIELAVWLDVDQSTAAIKQSYRSLKDTFIDVIKG